MPWGREKNFSVWWFCETVVACRAERVSDTRETQFLSKEGRRAASWLSLRGVLRVLDKPFRMSMMRPPRCDAGGEQPEAAWSAERHSKRATA
jgi:hypothetical protein